MKVLIDACVLYPTVLREVVLGVAEAGYFEPLWSDPILSEWRHTAERHGHGEVADLEILAAGRAFPSAVVPVERETMARLSLPDPDDVHVLAAAIDGGADELLTLNIKDFPTNALSAEGIVRRDPDGFLLEAFHLDEVMLRDVVSRVLGRARSHGIDVTAPRALFKRARLPRVGKALYAS